LAHVRGDRIPGDRMNGKWQAKSSLEWPRLPNPPPKFWAAFRWCMRRTFLRHQRPRRLHQHIMLDTPLGAWLPRERHVEYDFYRTKDEAFNRNRRNFLRYNEPTASNLFFAAGTSDSVPEDAHPIDARFDAECLWTSQRYNVKQDAPPSTRSSIKSTSSHPRENMAGSDGSVDPIFGGRGCAYKVHYNGTCYEGDKCFRASKYSTSYRSELEGAKGAMEIIREVGCTSMDQSCDNQSSINSLTEEFWKPSQMLAPEADIILACRQIQKDIQNHRLLWIKGHQDRNKPKEDQPQDVQMNIELDEAANASRQSGNVTREEPYRGSGAMLIIDDEWVTSNYAERIQEASIRPLHRQFFLEKYGKRKYGWKTMEHYDAIYWQGIGRARKGLSRADNIRLAKYINGWLNTGRQKGLFGQRSECPCCGKQEETQLHMFQCTHPKAEQARVEAFRLMERYYHQHGIPATVYMPFLKLCWAECERTELDVYGRQPPIVRQAIDSQIMLGGEFLLRGYISKKWLEAIHFYSKDKSDQKMNHLYLGLWTILMPAVWEQRNNYLHGDESIVNKYERATMLEELMEWKRQSLTRLGYRQSYLTRYTRIELAEWRTTTMKETIRLLMTASRNYRRQIADTQKQTSITDYFTTQGTIQSQSRVLRSHVEELQPLPGGSQQWSSQPSNVQLLTPRVSLTCT
jgi:ribonuclease HI